MTHPFIGNPLQNEGEVKIQGEEEEEVKGRVAEVDSMIQKLCNDHTLLGEQLKKSLSMVRELLDQREKVSIDCECVIGC